MQGAAASSKGLATASDAQQLAALSRTHLATQSRSQGAGGAGGVGVPGNSGHGSNAAAVELATHSATPFGPGVATQPSGGRRARPAPTEDDFARVLSGGYPLNGAPSGPAHTTSTVGTTSLPQVHLQVDNAGQQQQQDLTSTSPFVRTSQPDAALEAAPATASEPQAGAGAPLGQRTSAQGVDGVGSRSRHTRTPSGVASGRLSRFGRVQSTSSITDQQPQLSVGGMAVGGEGEEPEGGARLGGATSVGGMSPWAGQGGSPTAADAKVVVVSSNGGSHHHRRSTSAVDVARLGSGQPAPPAAAELGDQGGEGLVAPAAAAAGSMSHAHSGSTTAPAAPSFFGAQAGSSLLVIRPPTLPRGASAICLLRPVQR